MLNSEGGSNKINKDEEKTEEKTEKEEDVVSQYLFNVNKLSMEMWIDSLNTVLSDMGFKKTLSLGMPTEDALVYEYSREEEEKEEKEKVIIYQVSAKEGQLSISAKEDLLLDLIITLATHMSIMIAMDVFYDLLGEELAEKLKNKLKRGLSNLFKKSIEESKKELEEAKKQLEEELTEIFSDQLVEDIISKFSQLLDQNILAGADITPELLDNLKFLSLELFGDLLIRENPRKAMECYSLCLKIRDDPTVREKYFEAWQLTYKEEK